MYQTLKTKTFYHTFNNTGNIATINLFATAFDATSKDSKDRGRFFCVRPSVFFYTDLKLNISITM